MKHAVKVAIICLSTSLLSSSVLGSESSRRDQAKVIAYLQEIREIRNKSIETDVPARDLYKQLKNKLKPFKGLTEQLIRVVMGEFLRMWFGWRGSCYRMFSER